MRTGGWEHGGCWVLPPGMLVGEELQRIFRACSPSCIFTGPRPPSWQGPALHPGWLLPWERQQDPALDLSPAVLPSAFTGMEGGGMGGSEQPGGPGIFNASSSSCSIPQPRGILCRVTSGEHSQGCEECLEGLMGHQATK